MRMRLSVSMCTVYRHPVSYRLTRAGYDVDVTYKDVIHLRVRVLPPDGRVAVSVPLGVQRRSVEAFIDAHDDWIVRARDRVRHASPGDGPLVDGGSIRLWGRSLTLSVVDEGRTHAHVSGESVLLAGVDDAARRRAIDALYRREIRSGLDQLLGQWQQRIGKEASRIRLRRMTTRWGTCNTVSGAVTLNVALAEHPPEALEYVLVHELVHLWERGHGAAFVERMDQHLPDWRARRAALRSRQ